MGICGVELTATEVAAIGSIAFAIASEAIGRSKLKQNSVVDVLMTVARNRVRLSRLANTPKSSELVTPSRPSEASPAPRRKRGRPAKKAPSSQTGSK